MAAYPNETNPVRILSEQETRRLSIVSAQKMAQLTTKIKEQPKFAFFDRTRIFISVLATVCLTLCISNSLALNFTVICMFDENAPLLTSSNQTEPAKKLLYTDAQTSWLFSAVAFGALIGTFPISYLTNRFGFRKVFFAYGMISTISTVLIPLAVSYGFGLTIFMRVLEGLSVSTSFPAMGSIVADWGTLKRAGTYFAYLSTHLQFAPLITMPLGGELCASKLGWPSLYYILGSLTFLSFCLFYWFYRDSPAMHRNVSHKELTKIQKNKFIRVLEDGERGTVPYKDILTDPAVLGCLISTIGGGLAFQLFFQFGPIYLNQVLKFDVTKTGFSAALPFLLSMIVKFICGPFSDSIPWLSDKGKIIMFATISQCGMAVCMLVLAFVPEDYPFFAQLFFTLVTVFSGTNCVGTSKCIQVISGSFAYVVMSGAQIIMALCLLVLPPIVSVFCPDNTREEWSRLFIFCAILLIIVTIIFDVTCDSAPRPWTYGEKSNASKFPSKVAPADIAVEKLSDLKTVNEILEKKRLSIISGQPNSNLNLFEVSLGEPKDKDNSMNV